MPAWVGEVRALGMKWVSYFPGNFDRGLPDSTGIIILNDPEHGLPCCIMEGMHVTYLRTTACAAVAAKYLAPAPPRTLGLIGCGGLGLWTLRTMGAIFPSIDRVYVCARTRRSREEFSAKMSQEGNWKITPVDDPLQAVRNIDIVVTSMPPGNDKPVTAEAFTPGTLLIPLDLVNSWQDDVLASADRVVADNPAHFSAQVEVRRANASSRLRAARENPGSCGREIAARHGIGSKLCCGLRDCQYRCRGRLGNLPPRLRRQCGARIRYARMKYQQ